MFIDNISLNNFDNDKIHYTYITNKFNAAPFIFRYEEELNFKKFNNWLKKINFELHTELNSDTVFINDKKTQQITDVLLKLNDNIYLAYTTDAISNSVINITFYYNDIQIKDVIIKFASEFKKLIIKTKLKAKFFIVKYDSKFNSYNLDAIELSNTSSNIELNYGKSFVDTDKLIQKELLKNSSGLYLFHGNPGTGKTSYIRNLISKLSRKKQFVYIPPSLYEQMSDPRFTSFLHNIKGSILIIEDAEKIINSRNTGNYSTAISSLLNMTDGLLSDYLSFQIIATFNMDKNKIDSALLRAGRLKAQYEFKELDIESAQILANKLNLDVIITNPTSLANIYNITPITNIKDDKKIGF